LITDISKGFKTQEANIGKNILKGVTEFREKERENNTLNECPTCKKGNLRIMYSKKFSRSFIGCSNYPNCKQTFSLPPGFIKPSDKECLECKFPKLLSLKKGKKPWEFCFNSKCETNKKRIEEYQAKQQSNHN